MQLRHVGIVCRDLERSLHFYCDLLGCKVHTRMKETGQFIDTILQQKDTQVETVKLFMPEGEGQIELLHFSHPENQALKSLVHFGLTHIAIKVKELDSLYARLKSEFVEFLSAPALSDNKKAKVCFCKDPDGVFLEFVEVQN